MKNIKKFMLKVPQENRESVAMYLVWQSKRTKIIELIKRDLQTTKDIKDFRLYILEFKDFIINNKSLYEKLKINYTELLEILDKDIKYCVEQLKILSNIQERNDNAKLE